MLAKIKVLLSLGSRRENHEAELAHGRAFIGIELWHSANSDEFKWDVSLLGILSLVRDLELVAESNWAFGSFNIGPIRSRIPPTTDFLTSGSTLQISFLRHKVCHPRLLPASLSPNPRVGLLATLWISTWRGVVGDDREELDSSTDLGADRLQHDQTCWS